MGRDNNAAIIDSMQKFINSGPTVLNQIVLPYQDLGDHWRFDMLFRISFDLRLYVEPPSSCAENQIETFRLNFECQMESRKR